MTYSLLDTREIKKALTWLGKYWDKPVHPEFFPVRSLDEAVSLAEEYGKEGCLLAGGVDVLGLMKNKVISPRAIISLKNLRELKEIADNSEGLTLNSLTLIKDIEMSELVLAKYPILQNTAASIGSPQIRNMGTLAGNLLQDVRCWYYRRSPATGNTYECRRKTHTCQCYAANGENQYHAIMGGCPCNGVCPSDMASSLLALDARLTTVNTKGGRAFSIEDLYTPLSHSIEVGEIITCIKVPAISPRTKQRFLKFRVRKAVDYAIVSVATVITMDNNTIKDVRLVLGGVTYKPYRALKAEEILRGEKLTKNLVIKAAKTAVLDMTPLSKNDYKVPILETLVKRSILE